MKIPERGASLDADTNRLAIVVRLNEIDLQALQQVTSPGKITLLDGEFDATAREFRLIFELPQREIPETAGEEPQKPDEPSLIILPNSQPARSQPETPAQPRAITDAPADTLTVKGMDVKPREKNIREPKTPRGRPVSIGELPEAVPKSLFAGFKRR